LTNYILFNLTKSSKKPFGWKDQQLIDTLKELVKKGWVKCFDSAGSEEVVEQPKLADNYSNYRYLATKAGLLKHTGGE
jgi:hypothetical protein